MKKIIITTLFLIVNLCVFSQITADSIYYELKRQNVKYPELFTVLAISESGLGTYDEDSFLVENNNFWSLGFEKNCGCKNVEGFCSYNNLISSIKDLKNRFQPTLKKVHTEKELIKYLCMYYVGATSESTKGSLWIKKINTIYNDSIFE